VRLETVCQDKIDWETFAGRLVFLIQQESKHQYLRDLSRNVFRGHLAGFAKGRWQTVAPLGYDLVDGKLVPGKRADDLDYSYDADGNLIQKTNIATGVFWPYAYNDANQMVGTREFSAGSNMGETGTGYAPPGSENAARGVTVTGDAGTASTGTGGTGGASSTPLVEVDYAYDALGNRVSQTVTQSGQAPGMTRFAYDADGNARRQARRLAGKSEPGAIPGQVTRGRTCPTSSRSCGPASPRKERPPRREDRTGRDGRRGLQSGVGVRVDGRNRVSRLGRKGLEAPHREQA
jgi:YD repeat-containing protein